MLSESTHPFLASFRRVVYLRP